jgi:hypothetical protein
MQAQGYLWYDQLSDLPAAQPGYEIENVRFEDAGNGRAALRWDTYNAADRQARQESEARIADKTANLPRWILENSFLLLCQAYFGTTEKRSTKELLAKAFELLQVDQAAAMKAFAAVIGLDKELTRASGVLWWDSCMWHDDPDAITLAQAVLKEMGG